MTRSGAFPSASICESFFRYSHVRSTNGPKKTSSSQSLADSRSAERTRPVHPSLDSDAPIERRYGYAPSDATAIAAAIHSAAMRSSRRPPASSITTTS